MNKLIKKSNNGNLVAKHDKANDRYKSTYFDGEHYKDVWVYNEHTNRDIAFPIKRSKAGTRINVWHGGYCPKCGELIRYNFEGKKYGSMKQYCWKCGQLVDFEDKDK